MDAIIAVDEDQRVVLFNPAAERIFGCPASEALGADIDRFIPERFREQYRDQIRTFEEAGTPARRIAAADGLYGLRSDGEEFPIEASIAQTETRDGRLFTVILRDVSNEAAARERLAATQDSLETLIQNTSGMVYRCLNDPDWTMLNVSEGARDLTGYAPADFLDGSVAFAELIDPRDRERVWTEVQQAVDGGDPYEIEYRLNHRDGTTRWLSERGRPTQVDANVVLEGVTFDVTARRLAQEASDFLGAIVTSSDDAIIGMNPKGEIISWNASAERMTGHAEKEVLGRPLAFLTGDDWTDEDAERVTKRIRRGERIPSFEMTPMRKDGSSIDVLLSLSPVRDATGGVVGAAVIARDIADRKRAEERIRRSERRLRAMVENLPAGAVYIEGDRLFLNRRAEEITGYGRDEMATLDLWFTRLYGAEAAEVRRLYESDRARGFSWSRTVPLTRKDGQKRIVEFAAFTSDQGEVWMLQDVSEEKRAEATRASLARFLDESLNEIFVFRASDLRFVEVNRGARDNLGYSLEEMRGLTPVDIKPELTREQFEAKIAPLRSGAVRQVEFETIHARKDGTRYPVEVHLYRGPYEGVESFVAIILDITGRKAAAQREREAEDRVRRLEGLASISTLTAGIAHDVGAPMTAILGYAEMMEKSLTDEKNRERAHIIVDQVQRISQLVQALLNMARPGERDFLSIDLAPILETSLEFYREKLRNHGIVIERSINPVPFVAGDADRLQQVFLNLIINAVDAMTQRGTLRVVLASPEPGAVEVRFGDTGSGIDPRELDRIFEPFYTTKERGRGTGLGLVVAKGIVDEHGGEMRVESELGVGTEFVIRLPAVGT